MSFDRWQRSIGGQWMTAWGEFAAGMVVLIDATPKCLRWVYGRGAREKMHAVAADYARIVTEEVATKH